MGKHIILMHHNLYTPILGQLFQFINESHRFPHKIYIIGC